MNLQNQSWMILGPGRTGSKILVDSLVEIYNINNIDLRCVDPTERISNISTSTVYHSHLMSDTLFGNEITHFIISIRDMVDCALSWAKIPYIGFYHLYDKTHSQKLQNLRAHIPAFYLDPDILLAEYNRVVMFYKVLEISDISNIVIVDYDSILLSQNKFFNAVGLPTPLQSLSIPVKNPGTNSEWITNWDEISDLINGLARRPEDILMEQLTKSVNNCIIV